MTRHAGITLERFDSTGAIGFVERHEGDESVVLRLVDKNGTVSKTSAELFRPDLVEKQLSGHPYCGFVLPVPTEKLVDSFSQLDIVRADGSVVVYGRLSQQLAVNDAGIPASEILDLCSDVFCGVDSFAFQQGVLSIWGIVLPPNGRYADLECVGQDGVAFDFHWPIYIPDSSAFYWYYPGAPYVGFRIDIALAQCVNSAPYFEFYFRIKGEDDARARLRNVSVPKTFQAFQNYPGDFSVKRVQNLSSTVGAMIAGFTDYRRIVMLASRHIELGPKTRVLDWGCGFGRVARHFQQNSPGAQIIGVEIDDLNLDWMRQHLPDITPVKTNRDARIDLPDQSVDLIYGISVMTHIREAEQMGWLSELKRILAPGGLLILTTCGAGALAFGSRWIERQHLQAWRERGFVEHEQASEYDRDIGGGGYYIQAYQNAENTRRRWGEILDIVDIVPSVFGYQDVVIMRRSDSRP